MTRRGQGVRGRGGCLAGARAPWCRGTGGRELLPRQGCRLRPTDPLGDIEREAGRLAECLHCLVGLLAQGVHHTGVLVTPRHGPRAWPLECPVTGPYLGNKLTASRLQTRATSTLLSPVEAKRPSAPEALAPPAMGRLGDP